MPHDGMEAAGERTEPVEILQPAPKLPQAPQEALPTAATAAPLPEPATVRHELPATSEAEEKEPLRTEPVLEPAADPSPSVGAPSADALTTQPVPDTRAARLARRRSRQPGHGLLHIDFDAGISPHEAAPAEIDTAGSSLDQARFVPGSTETDTAPEASGAPASELSPDTLIPDTDDEEPDFVQRARRKARWHSLPVRLGLGAGVVAGTVLLAGQVIYQQRDMLDARSPLLRAVLEPACARFGCTIKPWKHIESVVIDNNSLRKLDDTHFRLGLTLRNTGTHPVAMPAAEIVLLNTDGKVLYRRVATPEDLLAPEVLPPKGEWSNTLIVRVPRPAGADQAVNNYRVAVFYP